MKNLKHSEFSEYYFSNSFRSANTGKLRISINKQDLKYLVDFMMAFLADNLLQNLPISFHEPGITRMSLCRYVHGNPTTRDVSFRL